MLPLLLAMGEAVGVGAGFDDGAGGGESVDDRSADPRVGGGFRPAGEGLVRGDGDGVVLFLFGEDLEEKLGASAVEFHVAEFVDHEQVDPAVAGDGPGEVLVVGRLDEFVHEPGGEGVFDPEPLLGCRGPEPDEEVALAGAGVTDEAKRLPLPDPVAGGESVDGGGVE